MMDSLTPSLAFVVNELLFIQRQQQQQQPQPSPIPMQVGPKLKVLQDIAVQWLPYVFVQIDDILSRKQVEY